VYKRFSASGVTVSRLRRRGVISCVDRETELSLVQRLRSGDTAAFDLVHGEFSPRLFSFLARLCRRRDVAEDLLEETWLRLITHASRLNDDTRLAPWLFTVARNVYASHYRNRPIEDSGAAELLSLWPSDGASPFDEASARQLEQRLDAALADLPPSYREVVQLVSFDGLRPSEAAERCGVTPEAMRQRLSRARAMLWESVIVAILSVAYLTEVIRYALHFYGVL
jgi:RNA polymerase sigma-70 factor (ECF subfamily)